MCSECSGDYEGDGDDQWGPGWAQASSGDIADSDPFEWDKSTRPEVFRTRTHGQERHETRKQMSAGESQAESEYEVFVSASEIIEIRRITGDFAGLSRLRVREKWAR